MAAYTSNGPHRSSSSRAHSPARSRFNTCLPSRVAKWLRMSLRPAISYAGHQVANGHIGLLHPALTPRTEAVFNTWLPSPVAKWLRMSPNGYTGLLLATGSGRLVPDAGRRPAERYPPLSPKADGGGPFDLRAAESAMGDQERDVSAQPMGARPRMRRWCFSESDRCGRRLLALGTRHG
jgi:hypothetical protein